MDDFDSEDIYVSDSDSNHSFLNCITLSDTTEIDPDTSAFDYNDNMSDTTVDVEFIEYNDYDEHFDATQMPIEEPRSVIDLSQRINNKRSTNTSNNVKQSISANSNSDLDGKIHKEADQICNLLPRFEHVKVYKALCRNRYAENRVELSLWDLLPQKRPPVIKFPFKRKLTDNVIVDNKEILDVQSETEQQDKIKTTRKSKWNPNKKRSNTFSTKKLDNGLIYPAKLSIGNTEALPVNHVASSHPSILAPPKLTCFDALEQMSEEGIKTSVNTRKNKNKSAFTNNRNNCNNASTSNAMNVSFNGNYGNYTPQTQTIDHFMQHLSCMVNTKERAVGGIDEHNHFRIQNRFRNLPGQPHKNFNPNNFPPKGKNTFNQNRKSYSPLNGKKDIPESSNSIREGVRTIPSLLEIRTDGLLSGVPSNNAAALQCRLNDLNAAKKTHKNRLLVAEKKASNVLRPKTELANVAPKNSEVSLIQPDIDIATEVIYNKPSTSGAPITEAKPKEMNGTIKKKEVLPPEVLKTCNELMLMFPKVDHNYIKKKCLHYFQKGYVDHTQLLEKLTEYLLQNGDLDSTGVTTEQIKEKENQEIKKQYAYLSGLFPDADPFYLKDITKQFYNDADAMMEFVQTQLEKPQYPTKAQMIEKIKIAEQQKQYTTKFNILQFLEIFPDPFAHFENPDRQCKFNTDAYEFLKLYFDGFQANTLMSEYTKNNHHLTLTVKAIEKLHPDVKRQNVAHTFSTGDIPLLQECAFLTHRDEIRNYVIAKERREIEEFDRLRRRNELWVCQCCFDNECMPSQCSTCDDGHVFCNACVIKGTEISLSEGKTRVSCFVNCDSEFRLSALQRILSPTQFSILLHKRQEAEVLAAGVEGLVSCPFCHFASIPPPNDKIFKCLNPECMKETCRNCKEPNHLPSRCYEGRSDKARLYLEEKMTKALVRKCFKCDRPYFKEDGCNKITCTCGTLMCYICDKQIVGYDHFDNGSHLTRGRCPLWSDNNFINAETVRTVAEQTLKHIKEKDPNVEVNVAGLIPETRRNVGYVGGHAVNSTVIPERASALTKFEDEDFTT